ncbi:MAG: HNH endonuclease [Ardenticatenaceae bacterium]|nr:HNH endonuclease [Anaerolineales bacterium]MCB8938676.1 HNH endonuclease [Ardenticatenaceae bacterium]MCB8973912.1 HNH endonuclease [Ardenticatenaceae bacterium]
MARKNWTREELIVAFNLYCKTSFGQIHNRNPEIIDLANLIGRTPSAVSWKLANFSRLDPSLQKRGIVGATHGSKSEEAIWDEFNEDWEQLSFTSEKLLAQFKGRPIEEIANVNILDWPIGTERELVVRTRVNQNFFRSSILAAYNSTCCITGLALPELLNASHIIPWADDPHNRVNPQNGLCLNSIHDRAFDRGLLTITSDYRVKLSSTLKALHNDAAIQNLFFRYDGVKIRLPDKFIPDLRFINYHNQHIFKG